MPRLMDIGLEKLRNMVLDMAELSQNTVSTSIDAFVQGRDLRDRIYSWSEELRMLQDEVSELAVELIARYQPVASDLDSSNHAWKSPTAFQDSEGTPTIFLTLLESLEISQTVIGMSYRRQGHKPRT